MNGPQYLQHLAGITNLMQWMHANETAGYDFKVVQDQIIFNDIVSNRFIIGVPRNQKWGKRPFLGVQKEEGVFLGLLNISRLVTREKDSKLHLIVPSCQAQVSEDHADQYPPLPPFVISLTLDHPDKIEALKITDHLDCRSFWIDDGNVEIGNKSLLWTHPIFHLQENAPLLTAEDLDDGLQFSDLLNLKNQALGITPYEG